MGLSTLIRRKERYVDPAPHTRQLVDNLLVTTDGTVWAGYRMGGVRWDLVAPQAKAAALVASQDTWAQMAGRDFLERVVPVPYPAHEWARRLDARTPNPLPDYHRPECDAFDVLQRARGECGCETWNRHLVRMQRAIGSRGMDDKIVFRYFEAGNIGRRDLVAILTAWRAGGAQPPEAVREVLTTVRRLTEAVAGPGWRGRKMTLAEQRFLRERSLAPGVPLTVGDETQPYSDGEALSLGTRHVEQPWDRYTEVLTWRDGKPVRRVVQVLSLTRDPAELRYPENGLEPWMLYGDRAVDGNGHTFGHEWFTCGRIATGAELKFRAERDLKRALALEQDYNDFREPPREDIGRGIRRAKAVRDEVSTGDDRTASRFVGSVNMIVWGEDVYDADGRMVAEAHEVVEERSHAIRSLYAGGQMGFTFDAPRGQAWRLSMAVPGEREVWDRVGFQRSWPLDFHATAMPNVSVALGDDNGPYMGPVLGATPRPAMHDPHFATEGRSTGRGQNLWLWVGTLGSGKTANCVGSVVYNAVRRGIKSVVRDPSGPTLAMCALPELAPASYGLNVLEADDGVLNPPSLVREPQREEYASDKRWERAVMLARGERAELVQDIARRMLHADLYAHKATLDTLREAARRVEWTRERTLWDLVEALGAGDEHGARLASALHDASERPRLSLMFAPREAGGDFVTSGLRDKKLIIVATPGIKRAPDDVPRTDWNHEERAADPIIYLTGLLTTREIYDKPMRDPAIFVADEAEDMTDGGVGRAVLARLGRDHSKWNQSVHLLLKNLNEVVMSKELLNFVAGGWFGRMATLAPAEDLLKRLGVVDVSHARMLLRLSEHQGGQFLHVDALGRPGRMGFDLGYIPWVRDAIFTDPGRAEASEHWTDPTR